jgi:alpha-beta hydrolase superfamily lysophospholipase
LLCHGLGSSKSNALPVAEHLLRAGYNVLAFDFRAHGESAGHVSTFGARERLEVLAAVEWLRRERPRQSERIFGVGASMGAAALVAAAADPSPEGKRSTRWRCTARTTTSARWRAPSATATSRAR